MKFFLNIFLIIMFNGYLLGQVNNTNSTKSKVAGICFRTDDNWKSDDFFTFENIFKKYQSNGRNYNFSLALNFARSEFDSQSYIDSIKTLQSMGVEIMDHTPNHKTNYFITKFDSLDYIDAATSKPIAGVDHIIKVSDTTHKVCLEFNDVQSTDGIYIGKASRLNEDTLFADFSSFDDFTEPYVYLQQLDTLLFISDFNTARTEAYLLDVWYESVNFAETTNIDFNKLDRSKKLTIDAIKVLANETQKLKTLYGFQPLITFIQPGGRHPIFSRDELKEALGGSLNYVAGASSFGESKKVYNEYDPDDKAKFGIQWGDFFEDHQNQSLEEIKTKISDNIAKHKIQVGHNHFYALTGNSPYVTMQEYFDKVDGILAWCDSNNIDVNTYSQWADSLYNHTPDPYQNVIPPLNVNLDNFKNSLNPDGVPDGYYERTNQSHANWEIDATAPSPGGYCFSSDNWRSRLFLIQDLGGLEKGENEFEIWTKGGEVDDTINVTFTLPDSTILFTFPSNTTEWKKYTLEESINNNKTLIIPDTVNKITIEAITTESFSSTPIKVSGMYLAKKKPSIPVNLKVILQGAYDGTPNLMATTSGFQNAIPLHQPFNQSPWNYTGTDSTTAIPANTIDWVLVELRSSTEANSVVKRKAGFVKNDGTVVNTDGSQFSVRIIPGDYYIVVYHRNHLQIMSATPVTFSEN